MDIKPGTPTILLLQSRTKTASKQEIFSDTQIKNEEKDPIFPWKDNVAASKRQI